MALLLSLFDQHHRKETQQRQLQKIEQHHHLQTQSIETYLNDCISDFYFLSQSQDLFKTIAQHRPITNKAIEPFFTFIGAKTGIDQVRFLDLEGEEQFRINHPKLGSPLLVPQAQLQKKGNRYYFLNSRDLDPLRYYISPLDLNVEHQEVEFPFKPMLRFAMPIYDQAQKLGVFVVNFLAERFLEGIRNTAYLSGGQVMLLNSEGYYLVSPNEGEEWGFALTGRQDLKFDRQHPKSWAEIGSHNNGTFSNEEGFFVFDRIDLAKMISSSLPILPGAQNLPVWILVTKVTSSDILQDHRSQMMGIYYSYLAILVVLAAFSLYFARHQQKLKLSQATNAAQTKVLKKRIDELHCLYDITHLTETENLNFHEMMQQLVNQIPKAWGYPQYCSVRLVIRTEIWRSVNFRSPVLSQKEEIWNQNERLGYLEVGYDTQPPEGGFLEEEQSLLQALALRILKVYQFQKTKELLQSHQEQLEEQVEQRTHELAQANQQLTFEVAEKQRLAETLAKEKQRAEEATKAKTSFLSLVAHDLKSPFFSILGILRRIVKKEANLDPKHRELLVNSIESGQRLLNMIDKLITINRIQTGRIKPDYQEILLFDLAQQVSNQYADSAEQKGIVLENQVPKAVILETDPFLLGEVMANLLSNAIKFCSPGDRIKVTWELGLGLIVEDTGLGIEPEVAQYLFKEQFSTTTLGTMGEKGTGLGLPYCFDIMRLLGGGIDLDSVVNQGSRFTLSFPSHRLRP
ncbi:MAG: hypothetical protein A2600_04845 [Candidatus Lambdaproteobacteria bacterium RIFOXYD1_FULL_56_27]|uniref:histidine kinase n=1 Tax=Candidatus Lambdaproteobacteria bacterium RIFOXYD2_FULL_56_26 TaxID=1817773 RepID=A0A1F6H3Y5_9PROT|nr:MAG: hypothetical protein A2426_13910 [Candidatus Lambdaproteobacteria bacterium RIFOXYC1_FULL_56_13]OGH05081.1 MAG: hypothetical protein A2557_08910 [Candidatus Lambdaproteobacteria bacterium RIFOXYD2_FULL_56_26]OGH09546.1 MAG: hypothetical protein A2600_04845 [Candidatus Lambdaproteobacteria bacterium RIFOXYD1_FULL_56_27]